MRIALFLLFCIVLPVCSLASSDLVRFTRSADGAITDSKTGRQWLEGPDIPTNWDQAEKWVCSLGGDWRMPTRAELHEIYIASSSRPVGDYKEPGENKEPSETISNSQTPERIFIGLDPAFQRDTAVFVCAEKIGAHSAWYFVFTGAHKRIRPRKDPGFPQFVSWRYTRGFAVRGPRKLNRSSSGQK